MTTTDSHTPIVVPCEELQVVLDHIENTGPMSTTTAEAIERIRGRFPAEWPEKRDEQYDRGYKDGYEEAHESDPPGGVKSDCEFEHPHPSHPCGKRTPNTRALLRAGLTEAMENLIVFRDKHLDATRLDESIKDDAIRRAATQLDNAFDDLDSALRWLNDEDDS